MTLRRGFKAEAERTAVALRAQLGLQSHERVDITELAKHLDVSIVSASDLIEIERLEELERIQAFAFSACTFHLDGRNVIVTNPLRQPGRQASDTAHELAHLLLNHDLTEIRVVAGMPFRTCRPEQEEEATALGGTVLLPRPLLLKAAHAGLDVAAIARTYHVTEDMARYRYNTTGTGRQVAAGHAGRSS